MSFYFEVEPLRVPISIYVILQKTIVFSIGYFYSNSQIARLKHWVKF